MFDCATRQGFIGRFGIDPDDSYRNLQLDIKVGGPVSKRLLKSIELMQPYRRPFHPAVLGERERQVMVDYANGLMQNESSERLGMAVDTVKTVRRVVKEKLGARSICQATVLCVILGLLDQPDERDEESWRR